MDARLTQLTVRELIERLATSDPAPGGGSAAAIAGATAAALVHMVVALSSGRPGAELIEHDLEHIGAAATTWQSELLNLAELDANAYQAVIEARRLPRDGELERQARAVQVAAATREATRVPLEVVRAASEVLDLAERLAPIGNRHAASDVGVAGLLAVAAMRGAALNVRINLPHLAGDEPLRADGARLVDELLATVDERGERVQASVAGRLA